MVRSTRRPSGSKMSCEARSMSAPARSRISAARSITWLVVAYGDKLVAGEDEGDGRCLRCCGIRLAHQRRGHVARAVLDVEPARDLDFLHFLARRDRDAERALEHLVFAASRGDEVE